MLHFGIQAFMLTSPRCFEFPSGHALCMIRKSLKKSRYAVFCGQKSLLRLLSRPSRRRKCMRFSVYAGRKHWLSHICNDTSFRTSFLVLRSTCACFVAVPMKKARKTTSKHSANHPHAWKYIRFPCCKASHRLRLRWATFTPVRAHRVYILCTDAHAPRIQSRWNFTTNTWHCILL